MNIPAPVDRTNRDIKALRQSTSTWAQHSAIMLSPMGRWINFIRNAFSRSSVSMGQAYAIAAKCGAGAINGAATLSSLPLVLPAREASLRSLSGHPFSERLHSPGDCNRRAPNHSLPVTGAPVVLPANNPTPQAVWIDLQPIAHALERKRSVTPVFENPELSFTELLQPVRMTRGEITLKTSHRVDQDAGHQAPNRLD
jgi:hypothetical protein